MRESAGSTLRRVMSERGSVVALGVPDPFAARLAENEGAVALYISGLVTEAMMLGAPDIGLMTLTELAERAYRIADAVRIPVISDADIGFVGGPVNVARTVRELEHCGLAGIHIEDQALPKRCPLIPGKRVLDRASAVARIDTAVRAKTDPDFLILARSDADYLTYREVVERCKAFLDVGADMVIPMFMEADGVPLSSLSADDQMAFLERVAHDIGGPAVWVADEAPSGYKAADIARLGYSLFIRPTAAFQATANLLRDLYRAQIREAPMVRSQTVLGPLEMMQLLDLDAHMAIDARANDLAKAHSDDGGVA